MTDLNHIAALAIVAAEGSSVELPRDELLQLATELNRAREVISLLRPMVEGTPLPDGRATLAALAAYDKVTEEPLR